MADPVTPTDSAAVPAGPATTRARLVVRSATLADVDPIAELTRRVYGDEQTYTPAMVRAILARFPPGQFVAVLEGLVVGFCATFRIGEMQAFRQHTWHEITGGGYASRHDPNGQWLYGMEVCVDPAHRGLRIGQRLYDARKKLCESLGLAGIVFGGRLPGLERRMRRFGTVDAYLEAVRTNRVGDATLSFQLRNDFELHGVLRGYMPADQDSLGYAAHLVWRNPKIDPNPVVREAAQLGRLPDSVRIAVIQYQQRRLASFEEFAANVEYFVDVVADYRTDIAVLPEMFTLQLLSMSGRELAVTDALTQLTELAPRIRELLSKLAVSYNVNLIGGSHIHRGADGNVHNTCYVCLRDGSVHERRKIHVTPSESLYWGVQGGRDADVVMTDCGPIGVMICYDSEFPELARHLVDQGALMLFVPFCTDERQAYLRVRYSSQARAIENQCFVALSGNVGNLPSVGNMDIQYAQSCILTPCDFLFARDGVAAEAAVNTETVAFADLRLDDLVRAHNSGSVMNLRDRRFDLYQTRWLTRRG